MTTSLCVSHGNWKAPADAQAIFLLFPSESVLTSQLGLQPHQPPGSSHQRKEALGSPSPAPTAYASAARWFCLGHASALFLPQLLCHWLSRFHPGYSRGASEKVSSAIAVAVIFTEHTGHVMSYPRSKVFMALQCLQDQCPNS